LTSLIDRLVRNLTLHERPPPVRTVPVPCILHVRWRSITGRPDEDSISQFEQSSGRRAPTLRRRRAHELLSAGVRCNSARTHRRWNPETGIRADTGWTLGPARLIQHVQSE